MKARFPESKDERAARLIKSIGQMAGVPGALESVRGRTLPPPAALEQRILDRLQATASGSPAEMIKALAIKKANDGYSVAKSLAHGSTRLDDLTSESIANLEAVIRVSDRPSWLVRVDVPQTQEVASTRTADEFWIALIAAEGRALRSVCGRVGCIMKQEDGVRTPIGTGWMVGEHTLVTNAHVASHLARYNAAAPAADPRGGWRLRPDRKGIVDFAFERGVERASTFPIAQVLYVQASEVPDIAVFRLEVADNGPKPPLPIEIDPDAAGTSDTAVFALGHPIADQQDDDNVRIVFGSLDGTKRISPGKLLDILGGEVLAHDCSTTNGSSGSPLIDFGSLKAVGLHYFGKPGERNEAVFLPAISSHPAIVKSRSGEWGI